MKYSKIHLVIIQFCIILFCASTACNFIFSTNESVNIFKGEKYNILILTIDSLRRDSLSSFGNPELTSPYIDRYFRDGTIFTNMFSQSGWTTPSLISIFTSLYPSIHGVDRKGVHLKEDINTIADLLVKKGYRVPDISYLFELSKINYSNLGFEPVGYGLPPHEDFNFSLLDWMEKNQNDPFCVWYHYPVVHLPYNPPEPYKSLYSSLRDVHFSNNNIIEMVVKHSRIKKTDLVEGNDTKFEDLNEEQKEKIIKSVRSLYMGDIRYVDNFLRSVFMKLTELRLMENTIVILTADHGEELFDHDGLGHASTSLKGTLYDELINIPLLINIPDNVQRKISEKIVQGIDVLPTIYELNGWENESFFLGNSFASSLFKETGKKGSDNFVYSETTPCGYNCDEEQYKIRLKALRKDKWKLIARYKGSDLLSSELYNIEDDLMEKSDLSSSEKKMVEKLNRIINRLKGKEEK